MRGLTSWEVDHLLARALVEISEGVKDGPGLNYAREMLRRADTGITHDPSRPQQPIPQPKPPSGEVITNRAIAEGAGATPTPRRAPLRPGTNSWFDALERKLAKK